MTFVLADLEAVVSRLVDATFICSIMFFKQIRLASLQG